MAQLRNTTLNDTGFLQLPNGTTAERPAAVAGEMRLNTTTGKVEFYNDSLGNWAGAAGVGVVATGGNSVFDTLVDGSNYRVHVFTSTGNNSFVVNTPGEIEYLIVAGGASGGHGGGGAGGLLRGITEVTPQTYTITVGAGGAARPVGTRGQAEEGINGDNSVAFGLTAIGGGRGSQAGQDNADAGGSGGGGGGDATGAARRAGTAGQGNAGGISLRGGYGAAGGGGGAGKAGDDSREETGVISRGGNGGDGLPTSIAGQEFYYAGGGGGGANTNSNSASELSLGGKGGGGRGARDLDAGGEPAAPSTGSGGGGAEYEGAIPGGGAGANGIVIIRYPIKVENTVTITNTVDVTDGLRCEIDFSNPRCYSGVGNLVRDSLHRGGYRGTINGSLPYINRDSHTAALRSDLNANNNILLSNDAIPTGNQVTLEFWNFGRSLNQSSIISGTTTGAGTTQTLNIHLPWSDGNVYWDIGDPFDRIFVNVSAIYQGWHHWVFTHNVNTGTKRIYFDGAELGNGAASSNIPAMTTLRLFSYWSLDYGHNGDIAVFRVYNREITAAEVARRFNRTRWRFGL